MSLGFKTFIAVLTLSLGANPVRAATPERSCRIFNQELGWTFVKKAESLDGSRFTEMVLSAIDWAHPPSVTGLWRRLHFSTEILQPPIENGPDFNLIAQLSRFHQMAYSKRLTQHNIESITARIVTALNGWGGNGLGPQTGLWILADRSPQGLSDTRAQDLRSKEHDYFAFVFRDWRARGKVYTRADLRMQTDFAAASKNREEKFELYLELVENAANSLNEEGYMSFAVDLAKSLAPEFGFGGPYILSTPQVVAIFNSLRLQSNNHYFKENTLTMDGDGFVAFRRYLISDKTKALWRDTQTKSSLAGIVEDWEREILFKINKVKLEYLKHLRPMTEEEVFSLRPKFERRLVYPP